jgi:hypothetical protein
MPPSYNKRFKLTYTASLVLCLNSTKQPTTFRQFKRALAEKVAMDYRIIITGIILPLGCLSTAYRDSDPEVYSEISGKLLNKEKKVEVVQGSRLKTTQFNIYLYLDGHNSPFIYREFEESLAERYWPSFTIGDQLTLYIHRHHGLVWGMSRNGVLVLNPEYKQDNEVSSLLWLSILGLVFVFVGVFWNRLKKLFSVGYKYS